MNEEIPADLRKLVAMPNGLLDPCRKWRTILLRKFSRAK